MDKKRIALNIAAPICGLAAFIAIWYVASASIGVSIILPSPSETIVEFCSLFGEKGFYLAIGRTLGRAVLSFLIAFVAACLFAFLSKLSVFFKKAFAPIAVIMRVMPTISVILLVLIWFKSDLSPYVITFLVIFPMLYRVVTDAADGVDPALLEMTKAFRLSCDKRFFSFYLPEMRPPILTGASITLSFSVKLTVAAEVLAFTADSIGRYMKQTSAYIETSKLLAWTVVAILLGFLLEGLLLLVKRLLVRRYHGKQS